MSTVLLDCLPAEIYSSILDHIPLVLRQENTLALIRAIPRSPIPRHHLWECIRIIRPSRIYPIHRYLRSAPLDVSFVKNLSLETWSPDADVLINFVRFLSPRLATLNLWIGPTFSPEHMEDLLLKPFPELRKLNLRFKP